MDIYRIDDFLGLNVWGCKFNDFHQTGPRAKFFSGVGFRPVTLSLKKLGLFVRTLCSL